MSLCPVIDNGASWAAGFRARAAQNRVPVSAMLELTGRCNLRCQHCYLGDQEEQHARRGQERSTEQVKASLREWADAGCLYLVITGGDPMLRPDFPEIYQYAAELGLLVVIFCNGTLVTDAIIDLFCEFPPLLVEISVYGATKETYEAVTQIPGSFEKAWLGIRRLLSEGVRLGLKTTVITLNEHELEMMAAQAEEQGCKFRYDAAISPSLSDGSQESLALRVPPEVVVKHDMMTDERRHAWLECIEKLDGGTEDDRLYRCGAGRTMFYCDPYGTVSPCLLSQNYSRSTEGRRFLDVWENELGEIRARKRTGGDSSLYGEMQGACTHCPAMNYLETGDENRESEYMKEMTRRRYETVFMKHKEVTNDE